MTPEQWTRLPIEQKQALSKMQEAIRSAEKARDDYNARKQAIRELVHIEFSSGKRPTLGMSLEWITKFRTASDPLAKGHIADNRWFMEQATMYAAEAGVQLQLSKLDTLRIQPSPR